MSSGQKIVSSLAKYRNGQLTCIVCNVPVKNEIYWTGHVNGRLHRDNINFLKRKAEPEPEPSKSKSKVLPSSVQRQQQQQQQPGALKRSRVDLEPSSSSSSSSEPASKKSLISQITNPTPKENEDTHVFKIPKEPGPSFSTGSTSPSSNSNSKSNPTSPGPSDLSSDSKTESRIVSVNVRANRLQFENFEREFEREQTSINGYGGHGVEDNDDMDVDNQDGPNSSNVDEKDDSDPSTSTPVTGKLIPGKSKVEVKNPDLPEGFFDDPKADAKARGIEFVDPEEAEWDKFVKEIASEELESDNILVVDEEESRKERELDEIEDMMGHWQRVIDLEKKKETRTKPMDSNKPESDSSGDEGDFNEELDWRVKKF